MRLTVILVVLVVAAGLGTACATPRLATDAVVPTLTLAERRTGTGFVVCRAELETVVEHALEPEEEYEKNKLNLCIGGAFQDGGNGFSVGFDYERRIHERWGLGTFAEWTSGDLREFTAGFGAFFHPSERTFLFAGPGIVTNRQKPVHMLFRMGAGYEFPLGRGFTIGPAVYVDIVQAEEPVYIAVLNIGKGW